jgi:predicted nucleic acid-binding protein
MPSKFNLRQIASLAGRAIFFDANVLIYLFWPTGSPIWEERYASVYGALISQKNTLLVDYLVVSEVINVALRVEYKKYLLTTPLISFKDYRNSPDGQSAVNDIYLIVKHSILEMFDTVEKTFSKGEMENFLLYDNLDFNDKAIVSTCKLNNFVLITNDKDFITSEIDILTGNPLLLRS